ncbi:GMC oxidoreductase [Paractinoplanes abujensis]|uniref:long-chain-alcohol oxidase n=1 Tax=Paractinoplanes abujensis TaxID=882441 RepID=A0A7W7CSF9_9ACTN|nr:GMC family oxidoreductase [Actinoplanes abujensis]MBB4693882.1 choline dehydrogenase-like flavoprotein [Actinoplanes abujensis]GID21461.1 GMC oxidoreductase [Actinoplanes abujensis]
MPQVQDQAIIQAVCDTFAPSLSAPEGVDEATAAFYRDGARARGIDVAVAGAVGSLDVLTRGAIAELLDRLGPDFVTADLDSRTATLLAVADESMRLRLGVRQLKAMTLATLVGAVDETGTNPAWPALGYPGPATKPPAAPKNFPLVSLPAGEAQLEADVVVIGSGAGGAIIAARAAQAGLSVLVLEAAQYRNEADFRQIDSIGAATMFLRGGSLWSSSGQMGVLAGATLGGGTVINSMVCLRTPQHIRELWTSYGLEGLDGPDFDKFTDMVWDRIGVNTDATQYNANTRAMITGLASLGYRHERLPRNAAPDDDATMCGYCNAGCQQGKKRSTLHTYLQDAVDAGARVVVGAHVDRIVTADGRATGVLATVDGSTSLSVSAGHVVVAAGGIESPAVLLRSGIGGPAVGKNLTLHPAWIVTGVYEEPVEAWHGQIQSAVSFDLTRVVDGGGFLVESLALNPGTWAGQSPFTDGRTTRDQLRRLPYFATWHGVSHDHGSGEVYLDADGRAAVHWNLDDDVDHRIAVRAHTELARMHREAGATEIFTFHWSDQRWRSGEDFDAYLQQLTDSPINDHTAFSAHQMGSCRLGADPATSVADGWGQLHDVAGVWIGDASALPTAPGVNPMITVMALAERTASALVKSL